MNIDSINNGIVIDHIQAGKSMEIYKYLGLENLVNIIECKNPRCITTVEEVNQVFELKDKENKIYRCKYCEAQAK